MGQINARIEERIYCIPSRRRESERRNVKFIRATGKVMEGNGICAI